MAESLVQVTEGSGKKLHTYSRTVGANTVEDEVVLLGEPYEASYVAAWNGVSVATINDHIFQLMAGASTQLYLRRIYIAQQGYTTTALTIVQLFRLTTAGTGGTVRTPAPHDSGETAVTGAVMTLPTVKGTEGAALHQWAWSLGATATTALTNGPPILDIRFPGQLLKTPRIPAGAANGFALKLLLGGGASNTCTGHIEWVERNF